jgi:rhomboid protease GluP
MRLIAVALRALFDAGMKLLGWIGLSGARWEWKKSQWRMSLEARIASWEMQERAIRAPVRMCRECRELVDRSLSVCPACGASMRGVPGGGTGRLVAAILPGFSSLTAVFLTANVVLLALPLVIWGAEPSRGLFGILSPPWQAHFCFGAKNRVAILELHQYWRLVTAGFLHGGLLHLAFNSYALSILGPLVESSFGWRKFLVLYLVSDVVAFAASTAYTVAPSVGASGPLFGLMGFAIVYGRFRAGARGRAISEQLTRFLIPALLMLFLPGIDNAAHAGGFVAGAGMAFVLDPEEPRTPGERALWALLTTAAVLILVGSFLAMLFAYPENVQRVAR